MIYLFILNKFSTLGSKLLVHKYMIFYYLEGICNHIRHPFKMDKLHIVCYRSTSGYLYFQSILFILIYFIIVAAFRTYYEDYCLEILVYKKVTLGHSGLQTMLFENLKYDFENIFFLKESLR